MVVCPRGESLWRAGNAGPAARGHRARSRADRCDRRGPDAAGRIWGVASPAAGGSRPGTAEDVASLHGCPPDPPPPPHRASRPPAGRCGRVPVHGARHPRAGQSRSDVARDLLRGRERLGEVHPSGGHRGGSRGHRDRAGGDRSRRDPRTSAVAWALSAANLEAPHASGFLPAGGGLLWLRASSLAAPGRAAQASGRGGVGVRGRL